MLMWQSFFKYLLPQNRLDNKRVISIVIYCCESRAAFDLCLLGTASPDDDDSMKSLEDFVNIERFRAFPKMVGGSLNEFSQLEKKVVILVVDDKDKENKHKHDR